MEQFMYVAWIRDTRFPPEDQDSEWVACIVIRAASAADAQEWGDHLAKRKCSGNDQEVFMWSEVHMRDNPTYSEEMWSSVPEVAYGEEATDKHIGW